MLKKQLLKNTKSTTDKPEFASRIKKTIKVFILTLKVVTLSIVLSVAHSYIFESPEEIVLKQKNIKNQRDLELIKSELKGYRTSLSEIQDKDDNLYRLVLGVDPVAVDIRTAGIGGSSNEDRLTSIPSDLTLSSYLFEINQLDAKTKVQSVSFDELTGLASENINRLQHRPSISPIAPVDLVRFSSSFGYRTHPIFKIRKFHKGIDLTALKGSPIYSTAKGKVIVASNLHDGYGNKVVVDHGYGYKTVYGHLYKIQVKIGQKMKLGDLIGQVGNTGISVSPHLHYEVRFNNNVINPLNFIFKDISQEEYQLITMR